MFREAITGDHRSNHQNNHKSRDLDDKPNLSNAAQGKVLNEI